MSVCLSVASGYYLEMTNKFPSILNAFCDLCGTPAVWFQLKTFWHCTDILLNLTFGFHIIKIKILNRTAFIQNSLDLPLEMTTICTELNVHCYSWSFLFAQIIIIKSMLKFMTILYGMVRQMCWDWNCFICREIQLPCIWNTVVRCNMYIYADESWSLGITPHVHWPNDLISRGTRVPGE